MTLEDEAEQAESLVAEAARSKPWQPYLDAALGFRNHWYPAFFSAELTEGAFRAEQILGEHLLFKRAGGRVYAVHDRCLHRGVAFSLRPESYTPTTLSCWYHGFTYDVTDGRLVAIITDPDSALVGKMCLRTYPIEERQGVVFVFVGDLDPPPPLVEDVQPGFLDADLAIVPHGDRRPVPSNWRLAAENGFDAAHIYIHRNAELLEKTGRSLPFSTLYSSREGMVVADGGNPRGVVKGGGRRIPVLEAEVEGVRITPPNRSLSQVTPQSGPGGREDRGTDTSMWLPCGLKVDPFPAPGIMQFEWYVPIDERTHMYTVTWGHRVASPGEAERFFAEIEDYWKDLVLNTFNSDDVMAREAMDPFYAEEDGWHRERLYRPDLIITEWRKLASRHNRGIQRRPVTPGSIASP